MLNAKAVSNLLRAMQFEDLKKVEEEDRPAHMEYFQGKYICLGKYLDADQHGMVAGKFLGKNQKDGRFKSQDISEDILCMKDSWRDGECPQDGSHISFEDLLGNSISQMTRSMAVAAIYLQLEWVHPGNYTLKCLRTYTKSEWFICQVFRYLSCSGAHTYSCAHMHVEKTCMGAHIHIQHVASFSIESVCVSTAEHIQARRKCVNCVISGTCHFASNLRESRL